MYVVDFVADSNSISQFGFLKGRSSQQQLLILLNEMHANLRSKLCSDVVYLDFRRPFYSVLHAFVMSKLQSIGITGQLLNWFRVYLRVN